MVVTIKCIIELYVYLEREREKEKGKDLTMPEVRQFQFYTVLLGLHPPSALSLFLSLPKPNTDYMKKQS